MSDRSDQTQTRLRSALIVVGQTLLIAGSLWAFLQGWRRDFHFPISFSGDALIYLMQSKSTIDNGWWWFNPMVGAPFGLDELAFPSNSNVDQGIVWIVSRVVAHAGMAVNVAWSLMVVLSGLSATWCLRKLGVSTIAAVVAGTLFAVCPYALYRNIGHFAMVIYLVPFVSTTALLLASGEIPEQWHKKRLFMGLLAASALLGFNYVYYAFFGCFFLVVASLAGYLAHRRPRILGFGAIAITLIAVCTVLNLAPSLSSWKKHGKPVVVLDKRAAEAEFYGLKVRQLISPPLMHEFPPFRWWNEKELAAQFPQETENSTARLGLIGTVGFLGLLALLLVPSAADRVTSGRLLAGASRLTIAALLFGTIGGFGSLFNLLVSPEIRAYARIAPFISFFSLAAFAFAMDAALKTQTRRYIAAVIVLAVGFADQAMAAKELNKTQAGIADEIPRLEAFVQALEAKLPERAMVLQLPFRTYLSDLGIARMRSYDHLKLYLVSHSLRWSYPALSNEQVRWQKAAESLNPQKLLSQLAAEGFAALVIDRYGYWDNGAHVIASIFVGLPRETAIVGQTDRYLALDIRALNDAAKGDVGDLPVPGRDNFPVPGDYDDDGLPDIAVFRESNGTWYIRNSSTTAMTTVVWGGMGDVAVPGDYDADGRSDIAVFRPSNGTWYIRDWTTGLDERLAFGLTGDVPIPGDYDLDGKTDVAVFRPSNGTWYIRNSSSGIVTTELWGGATEIAAPRKP